QRVGFNAFIILNITGFHLLVLTERGGNGDLR
ncbi:MAG: hypothetical protein JWQ40_4637, partial [Segetibacter sp.]|nr:hypothetical protein [Segetibacter sp.]